MQRPSFQILCCCPVLQLLGLKEPIDLRALIPVSSFDTEQQLLISTAQGSIKRQVLEPFKVIRRKEGSTAIELVEGDQLVAGGGERGGVLRREVGWVGGGLLGWF